MSFTPAAGAPTRALIPDQTYTAYLQLFSPLLHQQAALFQANAHHAAEFASLQATLAATQEKQRAEARERKADAEAAAAAAAAQAEADADAAAAAVPEPLEPVPNVNIYAPENVEITANIESDWRWGSVCLFFEHFLPLFPKTVVFKPELLLQSFMCQHHSQFEHKWSECSCPHPACQHLAELFTQILMLLNPAAAAGSKKSSKSTLTTSNFLPVLNQMIEKLYFLPNQTEVREAIQQIMGVYIDTMEERKRKLKEEEAELLSKAGADIEMQDASEVATKENKSKSLKLRLPIHPPGCTILAAHLHQLPSTCKLLLLHFFCEYTLGELNELKEACAYSNNLFHAGVEEPEPPRPQTEDEEEVVPAGTIAYNPFHSLGLSVPHGVDDDGVNYWCFVHKESNRVHLYRDVHTGAKSEFGIQHVRRSGRLPREPLTHGYEKEERRILREDKRERRREQQLQRQRESDGDEDMEPRDDEEEDDDDEAESVENVEDDDDAMSTDSESSQPVDPEHAPPTFQFTLLTHDLQAVQDFVQVGLMSQQQEKSLRFLRRLQSDILPNAVLMQKKMERIARREKAQAAANARAAALAEAQTATQRSQRQRKHVNYEELNGGDASSSSRYVLLDDDEPEDDTPIPNTTAADRASRYADRESRGLGRTPVPAAPAPPKTKTPKEKKTKKPKKEKQAWARENEIERQPGDQQPPAHESNSKDGPVAVSADDSTPITLPRKSLPATAVRSPFLNPNSLGLLPQVQMQMLMMQQMYGMPISPMLMPFMPNMMPPAAGTPLITPAKAVVAELAPTNTEATTATTIETVPAVAAATSMEPNPASTATPTATSSLQA